MHMTQPPAVETDAKTTPIGCPAYSATPAPTMAFHVDGLAIAMPGWPSSSADRGMTPKAANDCEIVSPRKCAKRPVCAHAARLRCRCGRQQCGQYERMADHSAASGCVAVVGMKSFAVTLPPVTSAIRTRASHRGRLSPASQLSTALSVCPISKANFPGSVCVSDR